MKLLGDIKAAARVFKQIRQARKTGAEVEVRHTAEIPVLRSSPSFFCTIEGCALASFDFEIAEKVQAVFKRFDYDTKMQLAFAPKNGDLWKEQSSGRMLSVRCYQDNRVTGQ